LLNEAGVQIQELEKMQVGDKVKAFFNGQVKDIKFKADKIKTALKKIMDTVDTARNKSDKASCLAQEKIRVDLVAAVRGVLDKETKSAEELFKDVSGGSDGVGLSEFTAFFKSLSVRATEEAVPEAVRADKLDDTQLQEQFKHLAGGADRIDQERFEQFLCRFVYRVVKDGVISEAVDIKSKVHRRLEIGKSLKVGVAQKRQSLASCG